MWLFVYMCISPGYGKEIANLKHLDVSSSSTQLTTFFIHELESELCAAHCDVPGLAILNFSSCT